MRTLQKAHSGREVCREIAWIDCTPQNMRQLMRLHILFIPYHTNTQTNTQTIYNTIDTLRAPRAYHECKLEFNLCTSVTRRARARFAHTHTHTHKSLPDSQKKCGRITPLINCAIAHEYETNGLHREEEKDRERESA